MQFELENEMSSVAAEFSARGKDKYNKTEMGKW